MNPVKMSRVKEKLSLKKSGLRTQVSVSYALMGVLPMLTMGYLILAYVHPEILSQQNLVIVVFTTVVISLFGFYLLRQVIDALSDFRSHLKSIVEDGVLDTPLNADEPAQRPPVESLEETVLGLIKHNSRLGEMFSDMEEVNWTKARELTRVNIELQRQIKKGKDAEKKLLKSNMQLSAALEKLKQLQQCIIRHERLSALSSLASGIAHDLNNALMPAVGFAELLVENDHLTRDPEKVRDMASAILAGAREAAAIVAKLRSFYRRDTSLNLTEVNGIDILRQACDLTKPKWAEDMPAHGSRINIEIKDEQPVKLKADAALLRDSIVDIILNAIEAMPSGGMISLSVIEKNDQAVFSVKDNGCGITPAVMEHCTKPFFTTKGEEATGMGLAIASDTARRHCGRIEIDSNPKTGTTVYLRLPLINQDEDILLDSESESPQRPLKILVIDDDPPSRETIKAILTPDGHDITLASTAQAGIDMSKSGDFDLLITDRAMPDLSGDVVAEESRNNKPQLPIIMVTGFGVIMHEQHEKPYGVDIVMSKPVNPDKLKRAILKLTEQKQASASE
jgi:signal transduction histidine kinase/ActR/RegA family two-component response regulator